MIKKIIVAAFLTLPGIAFAQKTDTTEVRVKVITQKDNTTVIVDNKNEKWIKVETPKKKANVSWFNGVDLGFSNFTDNTDYTSAAAQAYAPGSDESWFGLRNGKSVNVNIWLVGSKINLINNTLNLKTALGLELNNYRYESPIRYRNKSDITAASSPGYVFWDNTAGRHYEKNKLAADYLTVPVMLNVNFLPEKKTVIKRGKTVSVRTTKELGFSAGVSVGYLYSSRNKTITSDEGKEKTRSGFGLNPWKLSYVGELNLGFFSLYGSYAVKSMYKNGLDMTPYTVGIRF
ncbi:MAG: hypothetical protein QM727_12890 [Niabella sp.]